MGLRELERHYLFWGASPKRGRNLIGQYGQGGKAAIGHLGRRFTIEVSRPGDVRSWKISDSDYRDRSRPKTYEVQEVPKRAARESGYVRIRIDEIDKRIDVRRLSQRLAETYRPLLDSGAVVIKLGEEALAPEPVRAHDRTPISVNAAGGRVRGWAGIADPDQPLRGWIPGIRCYRLGRLISEGEFFGHPGPAQVPGMARLMGELDIPQVPLTMNKSDFDRDGEDWVEVEERVHRALGPIARKLARETEVPPSESALRVAEQVRRLLAQALRLSERADEFTGLAAASSRARKAEQDELPMDGPSSAEEAGEERPRVPPAAAGAARTRKGFGKIVIRSLDPSIRSTTLLEGDTRVVVINSRYPLYRERRGDVWYQLETAAREICQATEGGSVEEYEGRVNEIVLAAASLRERRRKPPRQGRQLRLVRVP